MQEFSTYLKATGVVAGLALFNTTAFAVGITGATIGGAGDVELYSSDGTTLTLDPGADLATILTGTAAAPGGNVELENNDFNAETTLTGTVGGLGDVTLSSLTASDWTTTVEGGGTLGETWFSAILSANGFGGLTEAEIAGFYAAFVFNGGQERFSDPNIAYVNDDGGDINVGLAGFFDASALLSAALGTALPPGIQISEIVQIAYGGGIGYLYSAGPGSATNSGQVATDGQSFTGNYNLTTGANLVLAATDVPLPGTALLFSAGLAFFSLRRQR